MTTVNRFLEILAPLPQQAQDSGRVKSDGVRLMDSIRLNTHPLAQKQTVSNISDHESKK
jgi:hypothetical protein